MKKKNAADHCQLSGTGRNFLILLFDPVLVHTRFVITTN